MRRILMLLMAIIPAGCAPADPPLPKLAYPKATIGPVVDDYAGTKIADPYRWMESLDSKEVAEWVAASNAVTEPYLKSLPLRQPFATRLTTLWNYPRVGLPDVVDTGALFYTHRKSYPELLPAPQDRLVVGEALHPYFGVTHRPGTPFDIPASLREGTAVPERLTTNNFGFVSPHDYPFAKTSDDQVILGMFGGSVGAWFCQIGAPRLVEEHVQAGRQGDAHHSPDARRIAGRDVRARDSRRRQACDVRRH